MKVFAAVAALFVLAASAFAQVLPVVFQEGLVAPRSGQYGRVAVHRDPVEALIVAGRWKLPQAGDKVGLPDGPAVAWEKATADKDGWVNHPALANGYALWVVPSNAQRVLLLEASGHAMVYVNGAPRIGDVYQTGFVRLPIQLHPGNNELLFQCAGGKVKARLVEARAKVLFNTADALYPDLLLGENSDAWGAIVVINASKAPLEGMTLQVRGAGLASTATPVPMVPGLGVRKVGFRVRGANLDGVKEAEAEVALHQGGGFSPGPLAATKVRLRVRRPSEKHIRSFLSDIDGSVQFYAVNPASPLAKDVPPLSLFLTLHGAAVQAAVQADSYEAKTWGHVVAPTNRRPYGFDWEDWGRLDALEVLSHAQKVLGTDNQRIYLTGHSMGGHGAWHLGVTYPDRFAAIGPSAAWPTFWTYVGKRPEPDTAIAKLLQRATNPSDTLALAPNLAGLGVYILHGAADDNVPVGQAHLMRDLLGRFHRDFVYHEQPRPAGHWWDDSDEPGVSCVDWPPLFDFFARHVIPRADSVRDVRFATANPGVSARCFWAAIEAQEHPLLLSTVQLRYDPGRRRFTGTTDNVLRLALDLAHVRPGDALVVELDGQQLQDVPWPTEGRLWLVRTEGKWAVSGEPAPALKGPHRYGPFREVFRQRMVFVYGTKGTPAENLWALAKARYDAETFWYRGNGAVDLVADSAFDPDRERDRNVVLYGNADTNSAWPALLAESPVKVQKGEVSVGRRRLKGEDLACLFLQPRPGSDRACVGVVAGTGVVGMRLTDRLPIFVSGVGYPDCLVLGADMLTEGATGVRAAGYFGPDWSVSAGEFAWDQ